MDDQDQRNVALRLDPDPSIWLDSRRLKQLESDLGDARQTLAIGGMLRKAVNAWLWQEISRESDILISENSETLEKREESWREQVDIDELGLLDSEVKLKLSVVPGCEAWAEAQWGHCLETWFLERKSKLDMASCRIVRISDKGLAIELFHRIKANEDSFSNLAESFGEGPESRDGGLISLRPLSDMPLGLANILSRMEPGEVLPPSRIGKQFAIIKLVKWNSSRFDSNTRRRLLRDELDKWVSFTGALAVSHLKYPHRIESVIP